MKKLVLGFSILLSVSCKKNKPNQTVETDSSTVESEQLSFSSEEVTTNVFAFGSCNHEDDPQTIWKEVVENNPSLWIWMGDNIYGDSNMSTLKSKYDFLKATPEYSAFNKRVPVIGTWDDHDYGMNDGNKSFAKKGKSKELLLEFLNVSKSRQIWKREGVYDSYTIGSGKNRVKVILLDTRSFQDVLEKDTQSKARYLKSGGDVLGDAQWDWLSSELNKSDAEVTLIVSSIQFLSSEHNYEKWANFPKARQRMLELLASSAQQNVIFLSGDRHIAEVSKMDVPNLSYPLYDITSSGMTHSYEKANEPNQYRVSSLNGLKNYGILQFEWTEDNVSIETQIKGVDGDTLIQYDLGQFQIGKNQ